MGSSSSSSSSRPRISFKVSSASQKPLRNLMPLSPRGLPTCADHQRQLSASCESVWRIKRLHHRTSGTSRPEK
ncbi:hypothetical protein CVT26_005703 [Gymnopilus dilepis]|uniref:Uncharacterized protein n=1 Tax=Gymnopilus dilepis TaxID=231916 RepID=A0A409YSJ3_9AGAR|nr:hypothetical protein CVT26_005703 [Gymnopilus dilepis]